VQNPQRVSLLGQAFSRRVPASWLGEQEEAAARGEFVEQPSPAW
jgi:hypothetical protein